MKTGIIKWLASVLLLSGVVAAKAQTTDELLQLSTSNIQGTARFSGMGGAFNALGGDFGSLSTNPAGIATYRTSEFSITPTLYHSKATTDFMNQSFAEGRTRFGLSNLGYVGTINNGKTSGLVSFNFGIGYNKIANFHKNTKFAGNNSSQSVMDMFPQYANSHRLRPGYLENEFSDILPEDWSTAIANSVGMLFYDGDNGEYFQNGLLENDMVNMFGRSRQSGSIGEYTLSFGGNISNKFQFGATIGMQDLEYINSLYYGEDYVKNNTGEYRYSEREEYTKTQGFGVNAKFGVIFKPVDALRLGLAVHTPTWYNVERLYNVYMNSTFFENGQNAFREEESPTDIYKYNLQTPYRLEAGIAYVAGKIGLISLDYEFVGNNALRIRDDIGGDYTDIRNDIVKDSYRGSSNIRVGAEFNLPYSLMLRAGFNYFQSPYKDSGFNFDRYAYSAGMGYRTKSFFIDLAYVLNTGKYHYAPYYVNDYRVRDRDVDAGTNVAVEKENIGRFMATVGFKF